MRKKDIRKLVGKIKIDPEYDYKKLRNVKEIVKRIETGRFNLGAYAKKFNQDRADFRASFTFPERKQ